MVETLTARSPVARTVPAVDRAARMLAVLREERLQGISDLARALDMNKGTARDILETLRRHRLVERDERTKQYRLGPGLVSLAAARREPANLPEIARPIVSRLSAQTGETVVLAVPEGDRLVLVDRCESEREMRITAPLGMRIPIGAGCLGKVVMAYATPIRRDSLLANGALRRFTPRSIVDPATYLHELEQVQKHGVALDDQEYLEGVRAVGAPVMAADGQLAAALAVVGMAASLTDGRLEALADAVRYSANEISSRLGGANAPRQNGAEG